MAQLPMKTNSFFDNAEDNKEDRLPAVAKRQIVQSTNELWNHVREDTPPQDSRFKKVTN